MNDEQTLPFVAVIHLNTPHSPEPFVVNVTLVPKDRVPVNGRYKYLPDCTLADLQAYADQLEAEVWQTFEQIKLGELAKDEDVQLNITIQDTEGDRLRPQKGWTRTMVVLLDEAADEAEAETAVVQPSDADTADFDDEPDEEAAAQLADDETEGQPTEANDEEWAEPKIIVAETEPVHEEPESTVPVGASSQLPSIAPSRARVRIAGQRRPVGDPTWAAVDIFIEEPALRASQAHALSSMNREVAGVLVGPRPEKQPDGRYVVHIHDTIIAKHTVMHGASVTYTPESWRYMNDVLHERYPDETAVMVGWYHTHPGFGIFLSGMDLFIHQNFFTQIWHVAFVLDPRAQTSGFFCWNREKTQVKAVDYPWPSWAANAW